MSIENQYGKYIIVCDNCEHEEGKFDYFEDAVEGKKERGYKSKKYANGWKDLCPDCQE